MIEWNKTEEYRQPRDESTTAYPKSCDRCGKVFKLKENAIYVTELGVRGSKILNIYHYPECYNHAMEERKEGMEYEWLYKGVRVQTEPQIDKTAG